MRPLALVLALATALVAPAATRGEAGAGAAAEGLPEVRVFKTPTCGCCAKWVRHLEASGFRVASVDLPDLAPIKRRERIPVGAEACHTALVGGYVIEGHVPATDVLRLVRERPPLRGLVVPGMPQGSPGMESPTPEPYAVYELTERGLGAEFARHR